MRLALRILGIEVLELAWDSEGGAGACGDGREDGSEDESDGESDGESEDKPEDSPLPPLEVGVSCKDCEAPAVLECLWCRRPYCRQHARDHRCAEMLADDGPFL